VKTYFSQKFIVVIMLMLSLIGQSSASVTMPCDMMNMSSMSMSDDMTNQEHNMSMMMDDMSSENTMADCCQENCDCAISGCHANSFTNSYTTLNAIYLSTNSNHPNIALPETQFLTYLFKPPII
jgi:hypothetical protein